VLIARWSDLDSRIEVYRWRDFEILLIVIRTGWSAGACSESYHLDAQQSVREPHGERRRSKTDLVDIAVKQRRNPQVNQDRHVTRGETLHGGSHGLTS
jgi:hypothetical protein